MTKEDEEIFHNAKLRWICEQLSIFDSEHISDFDKDCIENKSKPLEPWVGAIKGRDHCHITGKYRGDGIRRR